MIIHTRNEHPDIQANKLNAKISFACPTHNRYKNTKIVASRIQNPTRAQVWSTKENA